MKPCPACNKQHRYGTACLVRDWEKENAELRAQLAEARGRNANLASVWKIRREAIVRQIELMDSAISVQCSASTEEGE